MLKNQLKKTIYKLIKKSEIDKDLELSIPNYSDLKMEQMERVHHHLKKIEQENITMGLHTFGSPYKKKSELSTAALMSSEPLKYALKELLELRKNKLNIKKGHSIADEKALIKKTRLLIESILSGEKKIEDYIDPIERQRYKDWKLYGIKNELKKDKHNLYLLNTSGWIKDLHAINKDVYNDALSLKIISRYYHRYSYYMSAFKKNQKETGSEQWRSLISETAIPFAERKL